MRIIVYHKITGKIVRIYYPRWCSRLFWSKKNFVTGSKLPERDYAEMILPDGVSVDIREDTVSHNKFRGTISPLKRKALNKVKVEARDIN